MSEADKRRHRCCFSGHRPERLNIPETVMLSTLEEVIQNSIKSQFTVFICGMARGFDILAGEAVVRMKATYPEVRLICVCPYKNSESTWSLYWQTRYRSVLAQADFVKEISPVYTQSCFQQRNEWMVNHSSRIIIYYCGLPSGTRNTLTYAQRQRLEVINLHQKR